MSHSLFACDLFSSSLAESIILLTLTRLVVVFIFVNFSFALFTPPLGDFQRSPPRPTLGLGLSLDLGGVTASPDLGLGPTTSQGAIITLPLASSGYGEQDRRPIWLAPVNK